MSYVEDPEIRKWFDNADFRRALSIGFDRDQINETFWLGTGTSSSVVPSDNNKYNPGPEYRTMWATYDPKKANEMLDAIGLGKKDSEGYRLRTDGKGRLRVEVTTLAAQFLQFTQICEMIKEDWKEIGIDLFVNEMERSLANKRATANETQMYAWNNDGSEHPLTFPAHALPFDGTSSGGSEIGKWVASGGTQGMEPKGKLREMIDLWRAAYGQPEEEQVESLKKFWAIAADQVFIMGVIGMGAASMGTRVTKNKMGNTPERQYNSPDAKTPSISRPVQFYWKS
jgi:peptide/nickel transport system substrate-binding protein